MIRRGRRGRRAIDVREVASAAGITNKSPTVALKFVLGLRGYLILHCLIGKRREGYLLWPTYRMAHRAATGQRPAFKPGIIAARWAAQSSLFTKKMLIHYNICTSPRELPNSNIFC
jgi:hypothetical protein